MKNFAVPLALVALLPAVTHAQAVGGFQRRAAGPAPVQSAPAQGSGPVYSNAPVYNNSNNAPTQSNAPTYNGFPPVQAVRPLPPQNFQPVTPGFQRSAPMQTDNNAPAYSHVYDNDRAPDFRRRVLVPNGSNAPVYNNTDHNAAPTYNSNAPVYGDANHAGRRVRVTTPNGPTYVSPPNYSHSYTTFPTYNYNNASPVYAPAPVYGYGGGYNYNDVSLLGGYYYGNYCDTYTNGAYPSVYGFYNGLPTYVLGPGVSVSVVPNPIYVTGYLPFYAPAYPVTYNENNYYVGSEERVREVQAGGDQAQQAVRHAFPADSYQAAFGDIEQAWSTGNVGLLRKHVRDEDTKVSVFLKNKYAYSLASGDLVQITRDAFDRLDTVSFKFDHLRKARNGDMTAYGQHVYRVRDGSDSATAGGDVVPFTTDGGDAASDTPAPKSGTDKTVYVSYTLRHGGGSWYIVGVNSSPTPVIAK